MNEEEKQAVKEFEDLLKKHFEETSVTSFNFLDGVEGIHILNIIKKQQQKIEELDKENTRQQELIGNIHQKWKDKIREKIDLIDKEYAEIIEKNKNDLYLVNINAQRHNAMQSILEELLGE